MTNRQRPTRILAFDISGSPGFAVVEYAEGKRPKLVHATSIKTDSKRTDAERYAYIEATAAKLIYEYGPFDVVCREHFVGGRNKRASQTVFGAWAAIDLALGRFGYTIDKADEFTPAAVKKAATGSGKADKLEVEAGVRKRLVLPDDYVFTADDQSDAVAVALAWIDSNTTK